MGSGGMKAVVDGGGAVDGSGVRGRGSGGALDGSCLRIKEAKMGPTLSTSFLKYWSSSLRRCHCRSTESFVTFSLAVRCRLTVCPLVSLPATYAKVTIELGLYPVQVGRTFLHLASG